MRSRLRTTAMLILIGVLAPPAAAHQRTRGVTESALELRPWSEAFADGLARDLVGANGDRLRQIPTAGAFAPLNGGDFEADEHVTPAALILAGTLGAIGGLYLGAPVGHHLVRSGVIGCNCGEDPGLGGLITGAIVGSGVISALATYVTNGGRGGLGKALSKNLLVSGVVLAVAFGAQHWEFLLLAPGLHVTFAVQSQLE